VEAEVLREALITIRTRMVYDIEYETPEATDVAAIVDPRLDRS